MGADDVGKLRLRDPRPSGNTFDFGTVTAISESFSKNCSTTPIPSLPMDNAFCIESKTMKTITVRFQRVQPLSPRDSGADSTRWSNAYWYTQLMSTLSRWACKTDGYRLTYIPSSDNPYIAPIPGTSGYSEETGYIRNLSISYEQANCTVMKGSFEFHVGTMFVKTAKPEGTTARLQKDFQITITDADKSGSYVLLGTTSSGEEVSCIDSYTIYSGPEYPFEYIVIRIPRKKLAQVAPALMDGSSSRIVAGMNSLSVKAVGSANMIVSKVKLSDDTLTLTAYCNAERLRGYSLENAAGRTAYGWIDYILTSSRYGVNYSGRVVYQYRDSANSSVGTIDFKKGTNVWYVLQVAAMCLGARIFFTDDKAYVVDFRYVGSVVEDYGSIDLYPSSGNAMYRANVIGKVNLGDEGVDTIVNAVPIGCITPEMDGNEYKGGKEYPESYVSYTYTATDSDSIARFGERAVNAVTVTELKQNDPDNIPGTKEDPKDPGDAGDAGEGGTGDEGDTPEKKNYVLYSQAEAFGANYISYRAEPQQSVSFTLKEMRDENGEPAWQPFFQPASVAREIMDGPDEIYVSNDSVLSRGRLPQKLLLSSYERSYPKGTTTYTWGQMSSIDLASSTSQITTSLGNIRNR